MGMHPEQGITNQCHTASHRDWWEYEPQLALDTHLRSPQGSIKMEGITERRTTGEGVVSQSWALSSYSRLALAEGRHGKEWGLVD